MEKKYFLAIDCGTSALKAVIYDTDFKPVAKASGETISYYPKPVWAEQNPNEWWKTAVQCIRQDLKKANPEEIAGIGCTSQGHGLVLVDENCTPIHNCLIWPDLRAIGQAEELNRTGLAPASILSMGNFISAHYTAAKLLWVKQNLPEVFNRAYKFLLPKDFLKTKLASDFVTDVRGAGSTQMIDRTIGQWNWKLIDYIGFPREKMPEIHESTEVVGYVTNRAAIETGLVEGTPVIAGQTNGPITPILISLVNKGKIKPEEDYIILYTGTAPQVNHFTSRGGFVPYGAPPAIPPLFQGGGLSASGGGLLKWYKEQFGYVEEQVGNKLGLSAYQLLDEEAGKIQPGAEGLVFLPHMMGERRLYNDFARGVLYGFSLGHRREHFYRAVLEGITFQLKYIYDTGRAGRDVNIDWIIMYGGGSKSTLWRQIAADVFGIPVRTLTEEEAATINMACLISVGLKVYPNYDEAAKHIDVDFDSTTFPRSDSQVYSKPYELFRKVTESIDPVFTKDWSSI